VRQQSLISFFLGCGGVVARDCKLFGRVATRPERERERIPLEIKENLYGSLCRASKKVAVAGGVGWFFLHLAAKVYGSAVYICFHRITPTLTKASFFRGLLFFFQRAVKSEILVAFVVGVGARSGPRLLMSSAASLKLWRLSPKTRPAARSSRCRGRLQLACPPFRKAHIGV